MKQEIKWWMQRAKNVFHGLIAVAWVIRYGYPAKKLTVVGVTGTDGKTTTATLIYEILQKAGYKTGLISTVTAKLGDEEMDTGLHTTNPDARLMQPILAKMVRAGITHLVLEVTAHGIDQYRILGCNIKVGVLTNISHEHLDDFIDMERYARTKLRMLEKAKYAVINRDDTSYERFRVQGSRLISTASKTQVVLYGATETKEISPVLAGDYNKHNIGAAEAVAQILGIDKRLSDEVIKNFRGVPGRREEVKAGQKFRVVVDFAHTPNALESVLNQLKQEVPRGKKLVVVFGCTGGRDKSKRPIMGAVAARLADEVIITSDDTRDEDQDGIYRQIMAGVGDKAVIKENDRKKAIEIAVAMAKPGDVVLLAGKGHEKAILIGKTEYPWSDVKEVGEAIKRLSN